MPTLVQTPVASRNPAAAALAARRYRDADLGQRIAAASPHELVTMLYDGAATALAQAAKATGDDPALRLRLATRALAILDALDGALDHGRGGGVARALAASYAQVRALVVAGNIERRADLFAAAAEQIGDIGRSWRAITPVAAQAA